MDNNIKCCGNCVNCNKNHAGQNIVFHECEITKCIVEPTDRACEDFGDKKKS